MCRIGIGRVGYVPSWLCAKFAMCRVDPAPNNLPPGAYSKPPRIRPHSVSDDGSSREICAYCCVTTSSM